MAPGAPRPINRAWIKKHIIDHVIDGDGCAQDRIACSSSMLGLRLRSELKLYAIPADMGGFEYGLQMGFPDPRLQGLEILYECLDHTWNAFRGLLPFLLLINPFSQRHLLSLQSRYLLAG